MVRMAQAHKDYSRDAAAHEAASRRARVYLAGAPRASTTPSVRCPRGGALGRAGREMDVVVVFATREREMRSRVATLAGGLQPAGRL